MTEAPENHPKPSVWWRTIKWQSWTAIFALIGEAFALVRWDIPEAATMPLAIATLGLASVAVAYGGGSTLIDAIKAWRAS